MPALLSSLFMVFWLHLLRNFVENLCSSDEDEGTTYTSKEEAYNKGSVCSSAIRVCV